MGTIEKRTGTKGNVTYRAQIRLKGHAPVNSSFTRKTDAQAWIQDTESKMRSGKYVSISEARKHTIGEAIDRFIQERCPETGKYRQQVQQLNWFKEEIGHKLLSDVTPAVISQCKTKLLTEPVKRRKKVEGELVERKRSGTSINRYLVALSVVFKTARDEWLWCETNPVLSVKKEKENPGIVRYLSDEERTKLIDICKKHENPYILLIVVLALSTGMRKEELLCLRWGDVDLDLKVIFLEKTKNKERRRVPVRGYALELLTKHSKVRHLKSDFLFPSDTTGKPFDIRRAWERVRKDAKLKDFRFHDLRHSTASYLAMNGASLLEIAEVLGHKTLSMVKRYSHLAESHTASVVEKMNQKVFG